MCCIGVTSIAFYSKKRITENKVPKKNDYIWGFLYQSLYTILYYFLWYIVFIQTNFKIN